MPNPDPYKALQKSLDWQQGVPELPGVQGRVYYLSKGSIGSWPKLPVDSAGRPTSAAYAGDFTLLGESKWLAIDVMPDKSKLTSDAQGELPSQTQLNKLELLHPSVGPEATAASAYLNNSDNVFLVQDMKGRWRVVGSPYYMTKTTVTQDNGQGPTGTASTTIAVEATDLVAAPFYTGTIVTEAGTIVTKTGGINPKSAA